MKRADKVKKNNNYDTLQEDLYTCISKGIITALHIFSNIKNE
jgi:hypothetical protein